MPCFIKTVNPFLHKKEKVDKLRDKKNVLQSVVYVPPYPLWNIFRVTFSVFYTFLKEWASMKALHFIKPAEELC